MRGEYDNCHDSSFLKMELPPRARRIHVNVVYIIAHGGTTSACAENTQGHGKGGYRGWNYLRVRGEYRGLTVGAVPIEELPPRARRILLNNVQRGQALGTTSACAENTPTSTPNSATWRNYLRVRGEYEIKPNGGTKDKELPPRARRIPSVNVSNACLTGTTSACAENTCPRGAE